MPAGEPEPAVPESQNAVPSTDAAPRTLFPLKPELSRVVVSTAPVASMRATTRFVLALAVFTTPMVPGVAAYPASDRKWPSVERHRAPSDEAVPESVSGWFAPSGATGSAIGLRSRAPETRWRSTKTGAATPLVRAVAPSPTRTTETTTVQVPLPSHAIPPWVQVVPAGALLVPHTPAAQVRIAHSESCPGQSDGVWHWGSVVVVLEVGSVVVVAGAVVVVGLVVVVGGVMVVVVVVVGCVAARLSAASTMVLHCASSLSASAESPLPNAASSRSSLIAVARASRCAPSVARLVAKV